MRILIIDDEKQLAEALEAILKHHKYEVDTVFDGQMGLEYALSGGYDLIILDVMLPKLSGLEVISEIRSNKLSTPVLMLSAKSEAADKVAGLELGADDYIAKPFSSEELVARVRALSRRKGELIQDILELGDLCLDRNSYELSHNQNSIKLGQKEFQILEILFSNPSHIIPKEKFIEKIWGYDFEGEYNTVEVYISFLRKKLQLIGSQIAIKTIRNVGYCLKTDQ